MAVGAIDLIHCSLSVPWFVFIFDVSQQLTQCGNRFRATRMLNGCGMCEMFSDMPFTYGIVSVVVGVTLSLVSVVVVGR